MTAVLFVAVELLAWYRPAGHASRIEPFTAGKGE